MTDFRGFLRVFAVCLLLVGTLEPERASAASQKKKAGATNPVARDEIEADLRAEILSNGTLVFEQGSPDSERTVQAELIREAMLQHHRIDLENAIIEGDLDAENELFEGDVVFTNCRFKGHLNLAYADFKTAASFPGSVFEKGVRLEFASAAQNVDLSRAKFSGGAADFVGLRCEGMVFGTGVRSGENVHLSFDFCDVRKGFFFISSQFDGDFSCGNAHLQGFIAFIAVKFKRSGLFGLTIFDGAVLFLPGVSYSSLPDTSPADPSGFDQDADFRFAEFKGFAVFAVDFRGWANFGGVRGNAELTFGVTDSAPVEFKVGQKITFEGAADFAGLNAKRLLFERVQFKQCPDFSEVSVSEDMRFEGENGEDGGRQMFCDCLIFRRARVAGSLTFNECGFAKDVDFSSAIIGEDLFFNEETAQPNASSIFGGVADFDRLNVGGDLRFDGRLFAKPLVLSSAKIAGHLTFRGFTEKKWEPVTFQDTVDLDGAEIQKRLHGAGVVFNGLLEVQSTTIGAVDFRADPSTGLGSAEINGDAYFSGSGWDWAFFEGTKFKKSANFDAMDIRREGRFQGTTFAGPLSFRATRSAGGLHFEGAALSDATFRDVVVKSLSFSSTFGSSKDSQFNGKIDLRGCSYDHIDVDWTPLVNRIEPFDRQSYAQLQKALNAAGESESAAEVYKHRLVREVGGRWWLWIAYVWPWIAAKPFQLVCASFVVVFAGWVGFLLIPRAYHTKDERGAGSAAPQGRDTPKSGIARMFERAGSALALSVRAFIPFETAVAAHLTPSRPFGTTIALIIRLCGWALLAMLLAAASGLFRASP